MQELAGRDAVAVRVVGLLRVAGVLEQRVAAGAKLRAADALVLRNVVAVHAVLDEEGVPQARLVAVLRDRGQAAALVLVGDVDAGEIEHRGGDVEVEGDLVGHDAAGPAGDADDQRHAETLFVVAPLAGEAARAGVVAVVAEEDDDGAFGLSGAVDRGERAADVAVQPGEHAAVVDVVMPVFLGRVPPPGVAVPVHAVVEECGQLPPELAVDQRLGHIGLLVQPGLGERVRIVPLLVRVFGVPGVERDRQAPRPVVLPRRLGLDKRDRAVADEIGRVPERAVGLLAEVGVAVDRLEHVEHPVDPRAAAVVALPLRLPGDAHSELAEEAGPVAGLAELGRVARLQVLGRQRRGSEREVVRRLVQPGENRRPRGGADAGGDERVLEPHARGRDRVQVRRLQERMPGAAEMVGPLVVREHEEDVRPIGGCRLGCCGSAETGE